MIFFCLSLVNEAVYIGKKEENYTAEKAAKLLVMYWHPFKMTNLICFYNVCMFLQPNFPIFSNIIEYLKYFLDADLRQNIKYKYKI